ncbi:hypothetical protein K2173_026626 [Erythroxylum novogranatense]|uniref:Uncharacterized protein n=1 Tax=Erythroxylum novogranatense TaxID=1862640 RepID=A0AAV8TZY3_9ROSI|nr:hypothetical protein K2173_026626 [Erythroxylum novogranatense]
MGVHSDLYVVNTSSFIYGVRGEFCVAGQVLDEMTLRAVVSCTGVISRLVDKGRFYFHQMISEQFKLFPWLAWTMWLAMELIKSDEIGRQRTFLLPSDD